MKINLKLTARQLNTVVYCFNSVNLSYSKDRSHRVLKSILDEVMLKMQKKNLEAQQTAGLLFHKPKDTKFTFKYHEADCLEKYLLSIEENTPLNEYDRNAIRLIINKLNQQLA